MGESDWAPRLEAESQQKLSFHLNGTILANSISSDLFGYLAKTELAIGCER